jgi:hypothetical protein
MQAYALDCIDHAKALAKNVWHYYQVLADRLR